MKVGCFTLELISDEILDECEAKAINAVELNLRGHADTIVTQQN